jgi:hypothetical protein
MVTFRWIWRTRKLHLHWKGVKSHADAIYTGQKFNQKGKEGDENQSTMKRPNCLRVLFPCASGSISLFPWPIRTLSVKLVTQISGVFPVFRQLPAGAYVVVPARWDKIMQHPIAPPSVEYVVDVPFLCFCGYHLVPFTGWVASNWRCVTIDKRHMENVVVLHCTWEV